MRIDVLGVGFDDISAKQAVSFACSIIKRANVEDVLTDFESSLSDTVDTDVSVDAQQISKAYVVTPNPEIVWLTRQNETLRSAINSAGLVLADGVGITIGARILGTPLLGGRVPGIDFASALLDELSQIGGSVFLFGAKPGVAEEAALNLEVKYPGLEIVGTADGYFSDDSPIIKKINATQPDVLFVCLGSPKQEIWMAENLGRINAKLCAGLGGSLDVFAGRVKRAPVFFQKTGLEWLYRLIREPRRITRIAKLPLFVFLVIWKRITRKKSPTQ